MDNIQSHIKRIVESNTKIVDTFKGRESDTSETIKYCMRISIRYIHIAQGVEQLLQSGHHFIQTEFCCAILLRSALLDALMTVNLYVLGRTDVKLVDFKKNSDGFCYDAQKDGLKYLLNSFNNPNVQRVLDEKAKTQFLTGLYSAYDRFFEPEKNDTVTRQLKKNKFDRKIGTQTYLHEVAGALPARMNDQYILYSKYEHYSELSWTLLSVSQEIKTKALEESLLLLIWSTCFLCQTLGVYENNTHPQLFSLYGNLVDYIAEFENVQTAPIKDD